MVIATSHPTLLVVGASRGLGHALAAEFLRRDWHVIGTVRDGRRTTLHELADRHPDRVEVEPLDVTDGDAVMALRHRLADRRIDLMLVNAGTTTLDADVTMGTVATDEFVRVMLTNALGPMRVVRALAERVPADGLIGVMSSGQGSVADNERGGREVYRASKAALNMAMRSFAARPGNAARAMLLVAPG